MRVKNTAILVMKMLHALTISKEHIPARVCKALKEMAPNALSETSALKQNQDQTPLTHYTTVTATPPAPTQ